MAWQLHGIVQMSSSHVTLAARQRRKRRYTWKPSKLEFLARLGVCVLRSSWFDMPSLAFTGVEHKLGSRQKSNGDICGEMFDEQSFGSRLTKVRLQSPDYTLHWCLHAFADRKYCQMVIRLPVKHRRCQNPFWKMLFAVCTCGPSERNAESEISDDHNTPRWYW
jgi:hypothetical protein